MKFFNKDKKKKTPLKDTAAPTDKKHEVQLPDDVIAVDKTAVRKKTIINVTYWLMILGAIYVVFKYLIAFVMPFFIGFVIAVILTPLIRWVSKKTKLKQNVASIIVVALFYCTIGLLLVFGIVKLVSYLGSAAEQLYDYYINTLYYSLHDMIDSVNDSIGRLDPTIAGVIGTGFTSIINSLGTVLENISVGAINTATNIAMFVPGFLLNMLFAIVSTFFIAGDYSAITGFIMRQIPERPAAILRQTKRHLGSLILQFLRSYLLIMSITFAELSVGLLILGVNNFLVIAAAIAVFDIMPIVGSGTVLIPWALVCFMMGNNLLGIGLLVMYIIITVIRNIIEPKIIGDTVGLHPLVALLSMFVGAKLFGALGLFGLPISIAIIKSLNDKGTIKLFK